MRVFRRVMLGGGIDIDALPDTQKLYYKATAKVTPKSNSLGSPVIANKWDAITGEGIIACINDITTINNDAFNGASALTSVTIPNSVTSIGEYAFYKCYSLTNITIPDSVTSIGYAAVSNCASLKNITIPDSVTSIGIYAFYICNSLTSITIPDSVTTIGHSAFEACSSLTSVTIGNGVTEIGSDVFQECTNLTSVTIPNNVTKIGYSTFYKCTSMKYYDFSTHESVPKLSDITAFSGIPSTCKIIVPDALYDEWIAATNWSTYASYIIKKSDWDASQTTE